jgi:hypothetical protein
MGGNGALPFINIDAASLEAKKGKS